MEPTRRADKPQDLVGLPRARAPFVKLQRFLDVSQCSDRRSFQRELLWFAHDLEFGLVNAALVVDRPGKDALFINVGNMPDEFAETSTNLGLSKRDPVLQKLKQQSTPFIYDQHFYVRSNAGDLWERQAQYGYKTGLAVALHLAQSQHFLLGFDREKPLPQDDEALTRMLADLQLLAVHAQDAALRILGVQASGEVPHLTPREREILRWSMEGKTAWAVGQILNISEHTVNFHVRNAMKKLNAPTKAQAWLVARTFGLF